MSAQSHEAKFEAEHQLTWERWGNPEDDWPESAEAWVELHGVTGTAKVSFAPLTYKLSGITYVALEGDEFEVERCPRDFW